jgi:hypothetical protein
MAVLIFGIIALGTVAMSFAFSVYVFRICLQELKSPQSSLVETAKPQAGLIEKVTDRALSDVGRLFLMDARQPQVDNAHSRAESETDVANPTPALPHRPH